MIVLLSMFALIYACISPLPIQAEEEQTPEIKAAIQNATNSLLAVPDDQIGEYHVGIMIYTLSKAGLSEDNPVVQKLIKRLLAKFKPEGYVPTQHHLYEAAIDCAGLEAVNAAKYAPQINQVVEYVYRTQGDNGSWFYQNQNQGNNGDTSISQYAILCLWTGARAGIVIRADVLEKSAKWHLQSQQSDGSFLYHPIERGKPTITMTAAGTGTLSIIRLMFFGEREIRAQDRVLGVLEAVDDSSLGQSRLRTVGKTDLKARELDIAADKGVSWIEKNYTFTEHMEERWKYYYVYTLERMTAVLNIQTIGDHNWYIDGAALLLKFQAATGNWRDGYDVISDTCFGLLFLIRATAKILKRTNQKSVGGGMLMGGRGLPDDLGDVTRNSQGGIVAKKSLGDVDDLLSQLEKSQVVDIQKIQDSLVQTVQLGDPQKLIGQRQKILRLVDNDNPEVRRTALWALSRCSMLEDCDVFIKKLDDPDLDVVIEARNGLCWLSRQVKGLGESADPYSKLPNNVTVESATPEQVSTAVIKWKEDVKENWVKWYISKRPYKMRDDLSEPVTTKNR
jgi:hypothetical protein